MNHNFKNEQFYIFTSNESDEAVSYLISDIETYKPQIDLTNHQNLNNLLLNLSKNKNEKELLNLFKDEYLATNDIQIWKNLSINPAAIDILNDKCIRIPPNPPNRLNNLIDKPSFLLNPNNDIWNEAGNPILK